MSKPVAFPSQMLDDEGPKTFTSAEEEQKRFMFDRMNPRRKKFIERIGYDNWDPFAAPKEPMDIRQDVTKRTTQELIREFLQTSGNVTPSNEYSRGALECALGMVNREEKYRGIFDFCLWYHSLLVKEQQKK